MIRVENLTRSYGSFQALRGISFDAASAQVLGFLGPNGAGKTTAMRIMTGFMAADSGTVHISGVEVHEGPQAARKLVGWMPETVPVYGEMEVQEYLHFCAEARAVSRKERKQQVDDAIERVELSQMRHRLIRNLSRGYRQRVGLAQALLHDPEVLVLDEPTSGLDPTQIEGLHELLRSLAHDQGKTVVFSTHILSEVEAISDNLAIIHRGEIIFRGDKETLSASACSPRLYAGLDRDTEPFGAELSQLSGLRQFLAHGTSFECECDPEADLSVLSEQVSKTILATGAVIRELRVQRATIHDAFLSLIREAESGAKPAAEIAASAVE